MDIKSTFLKPWFIGSYGDNNDLFESVLLELIKDHISWRRDYHTDSEHLSKSNDTTNPEFVNAVAEMKLHINRLTNELKKSASQNSPRYFDHMSSDLLLPGLLAQLLTILYNPNNITGDVSPLAVDMELEAGLQIANMLGYNTDPNLQPCAWGHITSGGNTANYDSLWNARAISCYPLALKSAAKKLPFKLKISADSSKTITDCTSWECQNFSVDEVLALHEYFYQQLIKKTDKHNVINFFRNVQLQRVEHMGMASFFAEHYNAKQPLILVPATTYKSWEKALKLLGFGSNQLLKLDVDNRMRIDIDSLERVLVNAEHKKIPILAVVGNLGTTEFGSIDPLGEIVRLRDHFKNKGLNFYFHIDASWGGYLSSLFRNDDATMVSYEDIQKKYKYFPSQTTYDAFAAVKEADSVTVDPHKMGYMPFGTGAFICRNRNLTNLTKASAFVTSQQDDNQQQIIQQLKQYIMEGTKPGSTAVACCLTQRILPLNNKQFGRILSQSIHASEYFCDRIKVTIDNLKGLVNIVVPMQPDSNIFCLALNPVNNYSLARMNRFTGRVFKQLQIDVQQQQQNSAFFCTKTSLLHNNLGNEDAQQFLKRLEIKQSSFVVNIEDPRVQTNAIDILRHTLLNPWLLSKVAGKNYIDRYCDYLEKVIIEVVSKESSSRLFCVNAS